MVIGTLQCFLWDDRIEHDRYRPDGEIIIPISQIDQREDGVVVGERAVVSTKCLDLQTIYADIAKLFAVWIALRLKDWE